MTDENNPVEGVKIEVPEAPKRAKREPKQKEPVRAEKPVVAKELKAKRAKNPKAIFKSFR